MKPIHSLLAAALAASTSLASAAVLIDDFSDGPTGYTNAGLFESSAAQAGSMVGGARFDGLLCFFACDYNPPYRASLSIGAGVLSVTPPPAGLATTRVVWGNISLNSNVYPLASLGLDLSSETAFKLDFGAITDQLLVQFVVVSASGQSDYRPVLNNPGVVLQPGASQTLLLPFSSFVGSATFSNVSGLAVVLGGNNGYGTERALASFTLDEVSVVGAPVPEPSSAALLLAGLAGAAALRRRHSSCGVPAHR